MAPVRSAPTPSPASGANASEKSQQLEAGGEESASHHTESREEHADDEQCREACAEMICRLEARSRSSAAFGVTSDDLGSRGKDETANGSCGKEPHPVQHGDRHTGTLGRQRGMGQREGQHAAISRRERGDHEGRKTRPSASQTDPGTERETGHEGCRDGTQGTVESADPQLE